MLCRIKALVLTALVACGAACMAQTAAQTVAQSDPAAQLLSAVKEWVVREQGAPADAVQVATVDPRVQVRSCESSFSFDLPFSTAETVRVRCSKPVWQVFVRATAGKAIPASDKPSTWAPVSAAAAPSGPKPAAGPNAAGPSAATAPASVSAPTPGSPSAQDVRPVLVAAGALQRGEFLDASDVKVVQMPATQLAGRVFVQVSDIAHSELLRDLPAGTPIRPTDVRPILLVKKGQIVTLSINADNRFVVSAQLEALQDGKMGEQIKLKNLESGRIVSGVVQGPNAVLGGTRGM